MTFLIMAWLASTVLVFGAGEGLVAWFDQERGVERHLQ